MINLSKTRGLYIVKANVPSSTETVDYTVSVGGTYGSSTVSAAVVFVGKSRYFGGAYEVDCSDWIESFISKYGRYNRTDYTVKTCTVTVVFTYTNDLNQTSTETKTVTWSPETITGLSRPTWDGACGGGRLVLWNSGFVHPSYPGDPLTVKLLTFGGQLVGQTVDKFVKTTYMDRYGDVHNASMTNKYEIECYVDPDWFHMQGRNSGWIYNRLVAAMQNARVSYLGSPSASVINIPGISASGQATLEGRVKDVEQVELPSTYNSERRVPTMKITFEVYR